MDLFQQVEGHALDNTVDRHDGVLPGGMEPAVPHKGLVYWLILAISGITIVSGLVQMVVPGFVLGIVGVNRDTTSEQLFATIGMFMTIFGAMLLQALRSATSQQVAVFWAAMQKLGACIAVFIGVQKACLLAVRASDSWL